MNSIDQNLKKVEDLFILTLQKLRTGGNPFELTAQLIEKNPDYSSIIVESAASYLAEMSLSTKADLSLRKDFHHKTKEKHPFHSLIGLGWGMAATRTSLDEGHEFGEEGIALVADGYGYYYALYQGRTTLKTKKYPSDLHNTWYPGFDRGIGRRLWYHCRGDLSKLIVSLEGFDSDRLNGLWEGIGVASVYVGGDPITIYGNLLELSEDWRPSVVQGMKLAIRARELAFSFYPQFQEVRDQLVL